VEELNELIEEQEKLEKIIPVKTPIKISGVLQDMQGKIKQCIGRLCCVSTTNGTKEYQVCAMGALAFNLGFKPDSSNPHINEGDHVPMKNHLGESANYNAIIKEYGINPYKSIEVADFDCSCPLPDEELTLSEYIIHLNDQHTMSLNEIGLHLERLGY